MWCFRASGEAVLVTIAISLHKGGNMKTAPMSADELRPSHCSS